MNFPSLLFIKLDWCHKLLTDLHPLFSFSPLPSLVCSQLSAPLFPPLIFSSASLQSFFLSMRERNHGDSKLFRARSQIYPCGFPHVYFGFTLGTAYLRENQTAWSGCFPSGDHGGWGINRNVFFGKRIKDWWASPQGPLLQRWERSALFCLSSSFLSSCTAENNNLVLVLDNSKAAFHPDSVIFLLTVICHQKFT